MPIYFTSRHIPGLKGLNFNQRYTVLQEALRQVSPGKILALQMTKLCVFIGCCLMVALIPSWFGLLLLFPCLLVYVMVINPVQHYLALPYVKKVLSSKAQEK
ncbi:DUF6170 family protein [Algicola sagamiensis]|uniref:DUF6170 family protein n=1 Tax=Algicola sagamiensis TaxID=163869 RepID=UPI003899078D